MSGLLPLDCIFFLFNFLLSLSFFLSSVTLLHSFDKSAYKTDFFSDGFVLWSDSGKIKSQAKKQSSQQKP